MDTLKQIKDTKIIAISRGFSWEELIPASLALYNGGIRAFEVTFEQGKDPLLTADRIARLVEALPEGCSVGAGTVLNAEQVRLARDSGAGFIISPNTDRSVIEETKRLGLISIPGAMTPSEIVSAYSFGADIVKIFPAGILGINYFKAIRAPLEHIPMAAVAGITPDNIADFSKAGAVAFGISSGIYNREAVMTHNAEMLESLAEAFISKLR